MNALPYELLDAIVDGVPDRRDLIQIRTVNKMFCGLVTRRIFRRVTVKITLKSAKGFGEILGRDMVAGRIEAITFQEVWRRYDGMFVRSHRSEWGYVFKAKCL